MLQNLLPVLVIIYKAIYQFSRSFHELRNGACNHIFFKHSLIFVAEVISKIQCGYSHDCKIAEVDELKDFYTGQLKVFIVFFIGMYLLPSGISGSALNAVT